MKTSKHILFTGGGSAGHVTPNIALINHLQCQSTTAANLTWKISYLGSKHGIEKELVSKLKAVAYFAIATGKLRRYFSWKNFIDPLKILCGIIQSIYLCGKLRPDIIFSKGGFVSFPVVMAGWIWRIPIILHESDLTPGLANKLCYPFAQKICLTFADSARYFPEQNRYKNKIVFTGTPIRETLLQGDAQKGRDLCSFNSDKKIILVFGGSLGAERINQTIRQALPLLIADFQIIHICGINKIDHHYNYTEYKQFEYLNEEFAHVIAAADLVIARSGANTVYELLALKKPHIFIPLSKNSSRGDQIDNALHFANLGTSQVIMEDHLNQETLISKIKWLVENQATILNNLKKLELPKSLEIISQLIENLLRF